MSNRHLMAGEWIDPQTGQLRSISEFITCPTCEGNSVSPKGYDCMSCFGSGKIDPKGPLTFNPQAFGLCERCLARSLDKFCPSCAEMIEREMEAISFMSSSVVK